MTYTLMKDTDAMAREREAELRAACRKTDDLALRAGAELREARRRVDDMVLDYAPKNFYNTFRFIP